MAASTAQQIKSDVITTTHRTSRAPNTRGTHREQALEGGLACVEAIIEDLAEQPELDLAHVLLPHVCLVVQQRENVGEDGLDEVRLVVHGRVERHESDASHVEVGVRNELEEVEEQWAQQLVDALHMACNGNLERLDHRAPHRWRLGLQSKAEQEQISRCDDGSASCKQGWPSMLMRACVCDMRV